jgi:hypothetical protein
MYDDDEYLQNILLTELKPNTNNNNNLKSRHIFVTPCHENFTICDNNKNVKFFKNILYDNVAC